MKTQLNKGKTVRTKEIELAALKERGEGADKLPAREARIVTLELTCKHSDFGLPEELSALQARLVTEALNQVIQGKNSADTKRDWEKGEEIETKLDLKTVFEDMKTRKVKESANMEKAKAAYARACEDEAAMTKVMKLIKAYNDKTHQEFNTANILLALDKRDEDLLG